MGTYHLLGHSHIDAVWLWGKDETKKVCAETFSRILDFMDRHPGLKYCQSSAQYYQWMEDEYPELFMRIREKVAEGAWEVVGGSWVEFDGNIPSGESIVRQILYGKRYFLEKFGVDVRICWLPDSFGFPWSLPQILSGAGMKYFLTQKLNWNDTTKFPFNAFWWVGPDGSKVLVHLIPDSYGEDLKNIKELSHQMAILKRRHALHDLLVLFGEGDHGGGWSEKHVNRSLQWARLRKKGERARFSTATEYFEIVERASQAHDFPVIRDELYLQFHRGVYTTQARMKLFNRRAEVSLEMAEKLSTMAMICGWNYPHRDLNEAWKKVLFNQFHDTICGTCVKEVYRKSDEEFHEVFKAIATVIEGSTSAISSKVDTEKHDKALVVFNTLSWDRDAIVEIPFTDVGKGETFAVRSSGGENLPSQISRDSLLFIGKGVAGLGYKTFEIAKPNRRRNFKTDVKVSKEGGEIRLENKHLRVTIDESSGLICGIYEKSMNRDLVRRGESVRLGIFEDEPLDRRRAFTGHDAVLFDPWEVYIYEQDGGVKYFEPVRAGNVEVLERGSMRASVSSKFVYHQKGRKDSVFKQTLSLYSKIPIIFVELEILWNAKHRLAKLVIPNGKMSEFVTYEIPYGSISRRYSSSPQSSLEERARYEVPGQRWIYRTSKDGSYGISILNEGKYGFDATKDSMRVTLLRSPSHPPSWPVRGREDWVKDREPTDQGRHVVRMGIYPHEDDWTESMTVRRAHEFNSPPILRLESKHKGTLPASYSLLSVEPDNVVITVLKRAEDSNLKVIRLQEVSGKETVVTIRPFFPFEKAWEADLVEKPLKEVEVKEGEMRLKMGPNKIATVLLG